MSSFVPRDLSLHIFTDEGIIIANCECITISMLSCLNSKLQVKERDLSGESNE